MKILVTGCAGFIGSHTCEYLLKRGNKVMGIDNLNNYYDVERKKENLKVLQKYENFEFKKDDIRTTKIIEEWKPDKICHLASMAGVRYSIEHPKIYVDVNINGFINILEQARKVGVKQIVYASSSSVYGLNSKVPFLETDIIEKCNSPYAVSKYTMEILAKTYNQLYKIPLIGLRFFTVYGPRGRPDMAPYKFLTAIKKQEYFNKYGNGESSRDYTYIDDIIDGIILALNNDNINCEIYNLGNSNPISLNKFINICEEVTQKKAIFKQLDNQLGDVPITYANIEKAKNELNYNPKISLQEGLTRLYKSIR